MLQHFKLALWLKLLFASTAYTAYHYIDLACCCKLVSFETVNFDCQLCCLLLQDYLTLADRTQIYQMSSLDPAFTVAYNNTRDFVMRTYNLTEDQAITAITTVVDFGVTQVVDGKQCPDQHCVDGCCFNYIINYQSLCMINRGGERE